MDLMRQIQALYESDLFETSRFNQKKNAELAKEIAPALVHATSTSQRAVQAPRLKEARIGWGLDVPDEDDEIGVKIGGQHPGLAAVALVRETLSEFHIPSQFQLRFAGMKRFSGTPPYGMEVGHITIQAEMQSQSSVRHYVDVPVIVREGRMLRPGLIVHEGTIRVLTQNTIDDILGRGEIYRRPLDRKTLFSPPLDETKTGAPVPITQPGLYGVAPNQARWAAKIKSAVTGIQKSAAEEHSSEEHLDPAERSTRGMLGPGASVRLKKEIVVKDRGGASYTIPSGTKGKVIRDMEGDGTRLYVQFEGLGIVAPISGLSVK
jgi:hypothetical protein